MTRRRVDTRFPVLDAIRNRWSARSFADRMPEPEKLRSLFEAARLSPSAHNSQPVRFMLAREGSGDTYDRMYKCLYEHNQEWAHSAPVLVLASVTRRRFSQATGDFVEYSHCMHDLGVAVMSLIIQATSMGLHCHPLAAFDAEQAQEEFEIPPLFLPGMIIAVGYLGDPDALSDELRQKETAPRTRRSLEEMVFDGTWGEASTLFSGRE